MKCSKNACDGTGWRRVEGDHSGGRTRCACNPDTPADRARHEAALRVGVLGVVRMKVIKLQEETCDEMKISAFEAVIDMIDEMVGDETRAL